MLTPFFASPKSIPSLQSQTCHLKNCSTYQKRKTVYYKNPSTMTFIRCNFQLHGLSNIRHQTENRRHASGLGIPWRVTTVNPKITTAILVSVQSFRCLAISGFFFEFGLGHVITLSFHVPLKADCLNNCCTNKKTLFSSKIGWISVFFSTISTAYLNGLKRQEPAHVNTSKPLFRPWKAHGNRRGWKQIPLTLT